MPRGGPIPKPQKEPDFKCKSRIVTKTINMIMQSGKKDLAAKIVYDMLSNLNKDDPKEARRIFEEAVKNVMPEVEVRSRRIGGANYQVPVPVKHDRSETLALRWIIDTARSRSGSSMVKRFTDEVKQAYKGEGAAVKKKEDTHRMADANKAFAHFRW